ADQMPDAGELVIPGAEGQAGHAEREQQADEDDGPSALLDRPRMGEQGVHGKSFRGGAAWRGFRVQAPVRCLRVSPAMRMKRSSACEVRLRSPVLISSRKRPSNTAAHNVAKAGSRRGAGSIVRMKSDQFEALRCRYCA